MLVVSDIEVQFTVKKLHCVACSQADSRLASCSTAAGEPSAHVPQNEQFVHSAAQAARQEWTGQDNNRMSRWQTG